MRDRARVLAFLLLSGFLLSSGTAQTNSAFKSPIQKMVTEQESADHPRRTVVEATYARDGKQTEHVFYAYSYSDGSLSFKGITSYDDSGKAIAQLRVGADGSPIGRMVYRYDGNGNQVEQVAYDASGAETTKEEKRYESDRLVERKMYRLGELWRRIETGYRSDGSGKEARQYEAGGTLGEVSTYGPNGDLLKAVTYKADGSVQRSGTAQYDSEGRVVRTENFDGAGKVTSTTASSYNER